MVGLWFTPVVVGVLERWLAAIAWTLEGCGSEWRGGRTLVHSAGGWSATEVVRTCGQWLPGEMWQR